MPADWDMITNCELALPITSLLAAGSSENKTDPNNSEDVIVIDDEPAPIQKLPVEPPKHHNTRNSTKAKVSISSMVNHDEVKSSNNPDIAESDNSTVNSKPSSTPAPVEKRAAKKRTKAEPIEAPIDTPKPKKRKTKKELAAEKAMELAQKFKSANSSLNNENENETASEAHTSTIDNPTTEENVTETTPVEADKQTKAKKESKPKPKAVKKEPSSTSSAPVATAEETPLAATSPAKKPAAKKAEPKKADTKKTETKSKAKPKTTNTTTQSSATSAAAKISVESSTTSAGLNTSTTKPAVSAATATLKAPEKQELPTLTKEQALNKSLKQPSPQLNLEPAKVVEVEKSPSLPAEVKEPIISIHIPLTNNSNTSKKNKDTNEIEYSQVVFNVLKLSEDKYGWKNIHPNASKYAMDLLNDDDDDMEDDDMEDDDMEENPSSVAAATSAAPTSKEAESAPATATTAQASRNSQKGKPKIGQYDYNDPFIDDAEMKWEEQQVSTKDGFFVFYGPLLEEGKSAKIEKLDGPKKRRRPVQSSSSNSNSSSSNKKKPSNSGSKSTTSTPSAAATSSASATTNTNGANTTEKPLHIAPAPISPKQ